MVLDSGVARHLKMEGQKGMVKENQCVVLRTITKLYPLTLLQQITPIHKTYLGDNLGEATDPKCPLCYATFP